MSDRIPPEVIEEIFSRLPVKTLVRFKCISKSWRAVIGSSEFIKKHLINSSNQTLILGNINIHPDPDIRNGDRRLLTADYDSLLETNSPVFMPLNFPVDSRADYVSEILGSCNGLLCLLVRANNRYLEKRRIILWNPSTKQRNLTVSEVPNSVPDYNFQTDFELDLHTDYGFGYDFANGDYKVVSILQIDKLDNSLDKVYSEVKVYSLKLNSWKSVQDFPYYFEGKFFTIPRHGTFVNGALHWAVKAGKYSYDEKLIAAFDLGTEEYRLVPQPNYPNSINFDMHLGVLGGCLCLICDYSKDQIDIWVMKEYRVKESWIKLISIACDPQCPQVVMPIAYSKCRKLVLLGQMDKQLFWYDLESESVTGPEMIVRRPGQLFYLGILLQSLVEV